jgi:hypothetical protein
MRQLTFAVAPIALLLLAAGPVGSLRAESLKDEGFKVPPGEFRVQPGAFRVPAGTFAPTADFKPPSEGFRPPNDFKPDPSSLRVKPGSFTPPTFRPQADFTIHPGTFSIGNGLLKQDKLKQENPPPENSKNDKK